MGYGHSTPLLWELATFENARRTHRICMAVWWIRNCHICTCVLIHVCLQRLQCFTPGQGPLVQHNYSCTTNPFEMADQHPPPYPSTDSEKTLLPGEAEFPSAPPPDAQSAYPPPSSAAPVQPPYPPSAQPAPYPYPSQPYPPPTADGPPAAGTGYPASGPPVSVPPAVSYGTVLRSIHHFAHTTSTVRWYTGTSFVGAASRTMYTVPVVATYKL